MPELSWQLDIIEIVGNEREIRIPRKKGTQGFSKREINFPF
jgi:hypothetical protein